MFDYYSLFSSLFDMEWVFAIYHISSDENETSPR